MDTSICKCLSLWLGFLNSNFCMYIFFVHSCWICKKQVGENSCSISNILYFRSLRERWELLGEDLSDRQQQLEVCLVQWSSYDDSHNQFSKWLSEAEAKVKVDTDLKATLPEKKQQLHNQKVKIFCICLSQVRHTNSWLPVKYLGNLHSYVKHISK